MIRKRYEQRAHGRSVADCDVPVKGRFSVRAAQLDWLRSDHFSTSQNNLRLSTDVVFRFGK
jgi:hypothetical protein